MSSIVRTNLNSESHMPLLYGGIFIEMTKKIPSFHCFNVRLALCIYQKYTTLDEEHKYFHTYLNIR